MQRIKIKQVIVILFLLTLALGLTGVTFAYFNSTSTFQNEFNAGEFSTSAEETFVSPTNWLPGDETSKTLDIKNEGNIPMAVRVSYTESWKDSNNQDLPLEVNGIPSTIINLDNTDDWSKRGDYLYYNGSLDPLETASSPIKSVTFNKEIVDTPTCTTTNGVTNCTNTYNGYEDATYSLTFKIDTVQYNLAGEAWPEATLYHVIKDEYDSGSGYAGLYTGDHKDSFTRAATKDIYYYTTQIQDDVTQGETLLDKINVIFGGFCWQMLRTTDTGGVKIIYNGLPVDGKCENTRSNVNGLIQGSLTTNSMNSSYAYGSDFAYDLTNQTFTIEGSIKENINYSSDKSVIGYYTCKNANKNATCSTLYYLYKEKQDDSSKPYVVPFTIASTNYAQIGYTIINYEKNSPAYVGYMYNKTYDSNKIAANTINKFGSSVSWNGTSYTLNNVLEITGGTNPTTAQISNSHYFCENNTIECTSVGYIYYYAGSGYLYYILLENEVETVEEALNEMLYDNNVNSKDSAVKRYLELWYEKNMINYDKYIEDTIFCVDRSIRNFGGWKENENFLYLVFKNTAGDLSCSNITDQFSISNNKAKLKYKVSLNSWPEMILINNTVVRATGDTYWLISPGNYDSNSAFSSPINQNGGSGASYGLTSGGIGARPSISLSPSTIPVGGTGTMDNPYIIDTNSN